MASDSIFQFAGQYPDLLSKLGNNLLGQVEADTLGRFLKDLKTDYPGFEPYEHRTYLFDRIYAILKHPIEKARAFGTTESPTFRSELKKGMYEKIKDYPDTIAAMSDLILTRGLLQAYDCSLETYKESSMYKTLNDEATARQQITKQKHKTRFM